MNTEVVNLATGERRNYGLPPEEALVAAWRQGHGDYNTWNYPKPEDVNITEYRWSLGLGDWATWKPKA